LYDFDLRWGNTGVLDHPPSLSLSPSPPTLVGEGQIVNREVPIVDSWNYSLLRKTKRLLLRFEVMPVVHLYILADFGIFLV
jgi:hypothetical protein